MSIASRMLRPAWFEIDVDAAAENLRSVRRLVGAGHKMHPDRGPPGSDRQEQLKRAVSPPAVDTEVGVQGENPSGPVVGGHVDKARVGEVHRRIGVLTHELEHGTGVSGEAIGHLEDAAVNVLQDSRGGAFDVPQEVTTLRDDRLAGNERGGEVRHDVDALPMVSLRAIEQRHDAAGVEQDRRQRPNPFKCPLFDPRSRMPERNRPSPTM